MKLQGKVALVTGGGTGIGKAIAERFVNEGAQICISARRGDMLEQVAANLPAGSVVTCQGDMAQAEDIERMVAATVDFGGKLDVLVNNAGMSAQGPVHELDPAVWQQVMAVNLTGPFLAMKAAIPHMLKNGGGSIINIASVGGTHCLPGMPAYCASKAGLIHLSKQVALDYGPFNIRCNAVCPGGVRTEMTEKEFGMFGQMLGMDPADFFDQISQEIPLRRFASPEEMGGICAFLAGEDSSFITGASLVADAGTSVVDVVGASIMGSMRRGGVLPG
jgi:NAD(P)-dependent dehydrogenase (short-subunit alcohol dehydrogenase family)